MQPRAFLNSPAHAALVAPRSSPSAASDVPGDTLTRAFGWPVALLLLAFGLATQLEGPLALAFSSLGAIATCVALLRLCGRVLPGLLTVRIVIFVTLQQCVWMLVNAVVRERVLSGDLPFPFDVAEQPLDAVWPLLLTPIAGTLVAIALAIFPGFRSPAPRFLKGDTADSSRQLAPYLVFGALVTLAYWPATVPGTGAAGYWARVLSANLFVMPFFAGRFTYGKQRTALVWYSVLALGLLLGLLTGSRGPAFWPCVLFAAGRLSRLRGREFVTASIGVGVAGSVGLMLAGAIGAIRGEVGRADISELDSNRISDVAEKSSATIRTQQSDAFENAIVRNVMWTNVVVPLMSPDIVPFRGLDTFTAELAESASLNVVTGRSQDDLLELGLATAPATLYGFTVNATTSVEFGLLADGWSRGGAPTVLLFAAIFSAMVLIVERLLIFLRQHRPALAYVLLVVTLRVCIEAYNVPLLHGLRNLALGLSFFSVSLVLVELVRSVLGMGAAAETTRPVR